MSGVLSGLEHGDNIQMIDSETMKFRKELDSGGMGSVSLYEWTRGSSTIDVAMKTLFRGSISNRYRYSLKKEMKILSQLDHENIVGIYGVVQVGHDFGLVMEYHRHKSYWKFFEFRESMERTEDIERLLMPLKIKILSEIISAMNYLHQRNPPILHLDLKGGNVLLDNNLHAKVCDFGLSQMQALSVLRSRTSTIQYTLAGTRAYIDPQRLRDPNAKPTVKSDVYAFGILQWEILTDLPLYIGRASWEISQHVPYNNLRPEISEVPGIFSAELINIMKTSWAPEPSDRPSFKELDREIQYIISDIPDFKKQVIESRKHALSFYESIQRDSATTYRSWKNPDASQQQQARTEDIRQHRKYQSSVWLRGNISPRFYKTETDSLMEEPHQNQPIADGNSTFLPKISEPTEDADSQYIASDIPDFNKQLHEPRKRALTSYELDERDSATMRRSLQNSDNSSYREIRMENSPRLESTEIRQEYTRPRIQSSGTNSLTDNSSENYSYVRESETLNEGNTTLLPPSGRPVENIDDAKTSCFSKTKVQVALVLTLLLLLVISVVVGITISKTDTSCPSLSVPDNGSMKCEGVSDKYNQKCNFQCDKGYGIVGEQTITCTGEKWNNNEPTCKKVCTQPAPITDGELSCTNKNFVDSTCTLRCLNNHEIQGVNSFTCGQNGSWNNPEPSCVCPTCYIGNQCQHSISRKQIIASFRGLSNDDHSQQFNYGGHGITCTTEDPMWLIKCTATCIDLKTTISVENKNSECDIAATSAASTLIGNLVQRNIYPRPCD